jgi:hypothetical protein
MLEEPVRAETRPRKARQAFIDCDIHNYMVSDEVMLRYLDPRWHHHHKTYGHRSHAVLAFQVAAPRRALRRFGEH